jgi:phosphoglucomutase
MELEEIVNLIPEEQKEIVKETITKAIEAEKNKGIESYRKKDSEVLKYKSIVKELGYDPEKFDSVDKFKESIKQTVNLASDSELRYKVLEEKLNGITKQYEDEKNIRQAAEKKVKQETIKNKLSAELDDIYGSQYIVENILLKDELDIVGEEIVTKDGKSFSDFVNTVLELNKDNRKVNTKDKINVSPQKLKNYKIDEADDIISRIKSKIK